MEKTLKISNKQQIDHLVELMEKNPHIGRGQSNSGSRRHDTHVAWEKFAVELNSLGPPSRTGPEWQRVWIHYKANLKRKLAKQRENFLATGVEPSQELNLNATEEKVYRLTNPILSKAPNEQPIKVEVADATKKRQNFQATGGESTQELSLNATEEKVYGNLSINATERPIKVEVADANKKKENFQSTGGESTPELSLTATEEKVYGNLSINATERPIKVEVADDTEESMSTGSPVVVEAETSAPKRNKKPSAREARMLLLQNQAETQNQILSTLRKIEKTKHQEYLLKKQKFSLLKKSATYKNILQKLNIKIAKAKLEKLQK